MLQKKITLKPLAIAIGAAFATSLASTTVANATENPFTMSDLSNGYMVAESDTEGKCGAKMNKEGKCGMKMMDADDDGKITKDEFMKKHEAMFNKKDQNSDGVIDSDEMKAMEGKCGGNKMKKEGKCGEGKCGGNKVKKEGKCGEGKCGGNK